ncbi:MAG TPA: urea ABC transporter permease subunit UrtB [Thermohalobaculum sp.]|nr:urea ABC transporter permease subunit UrtB [Thermohalobaculum sp.]
MARTLSAVLLLVMGLLPHSALAQSFEDLVARLPDGSYAERAEVIRAIAATGDARAAGILTALEEGALEELRRDGRVVRIEEEGRDDFAFDALTGEALGEVGRRDTRSIGVNNALRETIRAAVGELTLRAEDPARRLAAARAVFEARDPAMLPALDEAIEAETDPTIEAALRDARAATVLATDAPAAERIEALEWLGQRGDAQALSLVRAATSDPDPDVAAAAAGTLAASARMRAVWDAGQNVWYGLSLGSVLLLAGIGLAICFGVMGVINMAHGELVMLGAYTTYTVQKTMLAVAPELIGWALLVALPLAFLVAGAVGVGIERGICRHLYGRPLETLLATWGVSLILQQSVRSIYGPTNRQVSSPEWMSGAFEAGRMLITWNRLWILVFGLVVFALLMLCLKRTPIGLHMRAVTQNRQMASAMGIRTGWVDAMTFGLGAGIAGLAGVALTQIDNVSPNLGQAYIIDSFMVVVFGGVGNLWGALAGAFSLGIINKFLEPYAGAVLAKVLVLVFIILFIQRRPRGLFALRGRAVEA